MTKITETIGEQTQTNFLRKMLKDIAQELSPQYEGNVIVGRVDSKERPIPEGYSKMYIAEESPRKKFLGVFPRTEKRVIFIVNEGFYGGAYGKKDMRVCLVEDKAETVVKKHLDQYVEEHEITEVHMKKGKDFEYFPFN